MDAPPVRFERRNIQRFALHLPISVCLADSTVEHPGFTQDLSARGVFFYTELPLAKDDAVTLTFVMPSEITLAETMRVRCRGRVVRLAPQEQGATCGVAVRLEGYEFLPEAKTAILGSRRSESELAGVSETEGEATRVHSTIYR
jgi:hypothetical protein